VTHSDFINADWHDDCTIWYLVKANRKACPTTTIYVLSVAMFSFRRVTDSGAVMKNLLMIAVLASAMFVVGSASQAQAGSYHGGGYNTGHGSNYGSGYGGGYGGGFNGGSRGYQHGYHGGFGGGYGRSYGSGYSNGYRGSYGGGFGGYGGNYGVSYGGYGNNCHRW